LDGRTLTARHWIQDLYETLWPVAHQQGFSCFLTPITEILSRGNEAQRWLARYEQGWSVGDIMAEAIQAAAEQDFALADQLCLPCTA
jgi:predicted glutamate--cysteine ligase